MKKVFLILFLPIFVLTSCKDNNKKNDQKTDEENIEVISGEFYYTDDAAIINAKDAIYGVIIDSMAQELAAKVEKIKQDEYDMVPVVIKGAVKPNPDKEGWEEVVEITKLINISKPKENNENTIEIDSEENLNI